MPYRAGTSFRAVQKARHLQRLDAAPVAVRTELIESNALRAVRRGYWEDALELYTLAAEKSGAGRSYLLLALHLQRRGADAESTRDAFATGVRRDRTCAQLVQAWALFESRQEGRIGTAINLLERAVQLDPSLSKVLHWKRFRNHHRQRAMRRCHGMLRQKGRLRQKGSRGGLSASVMRMPSPGDATREEATRVRAALICGQCSVCGQCVRACVREAELGRTVERPPVAYTIPTAKRGWRGRAEAGEDPQSWYDADGVRSGPPQNYWRQAMDERLHREELDALDRLLRIVAVELPTAEHARLWQMRMRIRQPQRNRKLLGCWVPMVVEGRAVAREGEGQRICVPAQLRICRANGPKLEKHTYGSHEAHLQAAEELSLELKRGDVHLGRGDAVEEWKAFVSAEEARAPFRAAELLWPSGASESVPASINASKSAEALTLAPPGPAAPASIGELTGFPARILYLSDYLLVVAPDGVEGGAPLAMDVWLRSAIDN